MDDLHYARALRGSVEQALAESRIVLVLGARQVGKTSLVREIIGSNRPMVTLDDFTTLSAAQRDPVSFLAGLPESVAIDEIQRAPELLLAMKIVVDRSRLKGRFLLTGSANILTLPRVADSLAGRMILLELYPLTQSEIEQTNTNVVDCLYDGSWQWIERAAHIQDTIARIVRGGYPEAVLSRDASARGRWFESYLVAILQRDVRDIAQLADTAGVARLLSIVAARTSRIVNYASLSSESAIPKTTLLRYLDILERLFLIDRLPAWSAELGRRVTKAPKLFVADTGIAAHLMHASAERVNVDRNLLGGLLETFVFGELKRHASWSQRRPRMYHYRETSGVEIDFILESSSGERIAVEVKASSSPTASDARHLLRIVDDRSMHVKRGILLHTGSHVVPIAERVHAVPVSIFWNQDGTV